MGVNVVGISAHYHDSACCILKDGVLVAAAEEERFSRLKADPAIPRRAFLYCLERAGLSLPEIDCVAYYEDPQKKLDRQIWSRGGQVTEGFLASLDPRRPEREIRERLGFEGEIVFMDHHMAHAASSFYYSGFNTAAILTVDGVGEWATTTYGRGRTDKPGIELFEEVHFPDSLGLLYSTITSYLGFEVNEGEYKVMGLAPYGKPLYVEQFREMLAFTTGGQYQLNLSFFDFLRSNRMYSDKISVLFGEPVRKRDTEIGQFHMDVARSLQVVLEESLLRMTDYLYERTGEQQLCLSGGVALNCVANGKIARMSRFRDVFVQPAANDAGCALGAAAVAHVQLTGRMVEQKKLRHVYLGPSYSSGQIDRLLQATSLTYHDLRGDARLLHRVAERLAEGKVIGWFHGAMEFGPRSLGARSILADPRDAAMRDRINAMVKKREGFRPFAPAVLETKTREHFDIAHDSPFMLETCQVISPLDLPAITHVDGSARVQTVSAETNPRFWSLLQAFDELTGCPILLNTSFNVKGEPIVCSPEDALRCFITTDIDCLVLEDFIIDRSDNDLVGLEMLLKAYNQTLTAAKGISTDVYTFV